MHPIPPPVHSAHDADVSTPHKQDELKTFLETMPRTKLTEAEIEALVKAADVNEDGNLQIGESHAPFPLSSVRACKMD